MAYFLRDKDYNALIRTGNLDQIAQDAATRQFAELVAQAELTSYIGNRYQTSKIFAPLLSWDITKAYTYNDRLNFDYPEFVLTTVYTSGQFVAYQGSIYQKNATVAPAATLPTNVTYFDFRGTQGVYYITPPAAYSSSTSYTATTGKVSYKNYLFIRNSTVSGYQAGIAPDNTLYWNQITDYAPYAATAGTWPTDATVWTYGDPRNQQVVMYCVDIALYHVHANLNPRNIPQLRIDRYNNALNWCKMVNAGDVTADLPEILPIQGYSIISGSNEKLNQYW